MDLRALCVSLLFVALSLTSGCSRAESFADADPMLEVTFAEGAAGERPETLNLKAKRYLAIYHGASWCPPCQTFSPALVGFYRKADLSRFTLIMVNYDRSHAEMVRYQRQHQMSFGSVQREHAGPWAASTGRGIPNLVVVDTHTGEVVASAYEGGRYVGPKAPLEALRKLIAD